LRRPEFRNRYHSWDIRGCTPLHLIKYFNLIVYSEVPTLSGPQGKDVLDSKLGYDPQVNLKAYRNTIDKMETASDMFELVTGYSILDSLMGGIPKEGAMVSMPGKPFHGKSIFLDNLIVRMLRMNPKLQILLHHVDDASLLRLPRILGVMSGLPSRQISKAGASLAGTFGEEFEVKYRKAEAELARWIEDERLILADQSVLVNSLTAHERWIKEIRRRNQGSYLVSIGDNFHLFDMPGMEPGENKVREMSKFISNLPTKHGITTMFTMELPKDTLRAGIRPKYTDSKNSGGISFDSKVNMNIIATQRTRDCLLRTAGSSNRGTVKGSHTEDNSI